MARDNPVFWEHSSDWLIWEAFFRGHKIAGVEKALSGEWVITTSHGGTNYGRVIQDTLALAKSWVEQRKYSLERLD